VGRTPHLVTFKPDEVRPEIAANSMVSAAGLVSRPVTTVPLLPRKVPKALHIFSVNSGEMYERVKPRIPDVPKNCNWLSLFI